MFYINKDTELDIALLSKMINRFRMNVEPNLRNYKNYYDGLQKILCKQYADPSKPCNQVVINYCKAIVDSYCGYIAAPGSISYRSSEDITEIMDILKYNDYQTEDSDFLLDALIYGVSYELMYTDNAGRTRFRLINPTTCFGVYDDSLTNDLLYFVRMYKFDDWDETDKYCIDVYSDYDIKHYTMEGFDGYPVFVNKEPHYFSQCPANIFTLPDEKSIFDCILGLQDASNELLSDEIDDYSAFCDAYLALVGVDADAEDIAAMKQNRVLVLPQDSSAQWLTKNASDTQVENILKRVQEAIYRVAQCVDFSIESVAGGVSSGIAIRYRLTGMENRAGVIEGRMKKALQRRVEIICGIASLKLGEDVFQDVQIDFIRNIPTDNSEVVNLVNSLKGIVSDATLLGLIPMVSDVNAELEAVKKQKESELSLYNFGDSDE